ncbi:MAG: VCBS repeat-containing protein [Verrucomicrobiota bacterium]
MLVATSPGVEPFFADASSRLGHVHFEDSFDDWSEQPLLPRRLSRLGPGVSWYDFNGDGWEDLIVTGGRGGKLAVFTNDHGGNFRMIENIPANATDQGAVLGWHDDKGNRNLLVAVSNYGISGNQESEVAVFSLTNSAAPRRWSPLHGGY